MLRLSLSPGNGWLEAFLALGCRLFIAHPHANAGFRFRVLLQDFGIGGAGNLTLIKACKCQTKGQQIVRSGFRFRPVVVGVEMGIGCAVKFLLPKIALAQIEFSPPNFGVIWPGLQERLQDLFGPFKLANLHFALGRCQDFLRCRAELGGLDGPFNAIIEYAGKAGQAFGFRQAGIDDVAIGVKGQRAQCAGFRGGRGQVGYLDI